MTIPDSFMTIEGQRYRVFWCKETQQNEMGITPPNTYLMGFDYCNCGMDCCRSGIGGRVLETIYFPARFQAAMEWEEKMRAKGGALAGKAFCARQRDGVKQPLPLRQILEEYVPVVRSYLVVRLLNP